MSAKRAPLKTSVQRKTTFSDDTSCVNLIVAWNKLAKSMKLLISFAGKGPHSMPSMYLFQKVGFCWLAASSCFFRCEP